MASTYQASLKNLLHIVIGPALAGADQSKYAIINHWLSLLYLHYPDFTHQFDNDRF